MRVALVISLVLALASATSAAAVERILGGQETSISQYPFMANLLHSQDYSFFMPACAGAIISAKSILTTASCLPSSPGLIRARVGSSFASSGGTVLGINAQIYLRLYNPITLDNDIAILQTVITFVPDAVMPIGFASATSVIPDDTLVTIAGWGRNEVGHFSEQLRHTQVLTMNSRQCETWLSSNAYIPFNKVCTTGNGIGSPIPDACIGDNGGPVILNNVVVGLVALPQCSFISIHTRVSSFSDFIESNM